MLWCAPKLHVHYHAVEPGRFWDPFLDPSNPLWLAVQVPVIVHECNRARDVGGGRCLLGYTFLATYINIYVANIFAILCRTEGTMWTILMMLPVKPTLPLASTWPRHAEGPPWPEKQILETSVGQVGSFWVLMGVRWELPRGYFGKPRCSGRPGGFCDLVTSPSQCCDVHPHAGNTIEPSMIWHKQTEVPEPSYCFYPN